MKTFVIGILLLFTFVMANAQDKSKADVWPPLSFLEGNWKGTGDGMNGHSEVTKSYSFILSRNFLEMRTRSVFEPQEKNPKGEVHEDICILSYDQGRQKFILRGFYVEGFVNTYVHEDSAGSDTEIVFVTESVENAPPGTKAKVTFRHVSENEIEEKFFVAFPGQDLSCFSTIILKKQ